MRRFADLSFFLIASIVVALAGAGGALAQKRVALVIGNAAYEHTARLANPKNDATDIAAALKSHGIKVIDGFDLDKLTFDRKVREFAVALRGADAGIFFYAGHGLQVNGTNYLVPVDAKAEGTETLEFEMVRVGLIHGAMEQLTRTNILFLDACRNNPLGRSLATNMGTRSVQIGRGLKIAESGVGTLISFSTAPDTVAQDGDGRNSPYAGALVRHITSSTTDLANILIAVRNDVITQTRNEQVPWDQSALVGRFFFNPALASSADAPRTSEPMRLSEAAEAWDRAKDATSIQMLEAFAGRYKETFYADIARNRIEELKKRELAAAEALRAKQAEDLKRAEAEAARKKAEDEARAKTEAENKRRELILQEETRKHAEAEAARKKVEDEARAKAEAETKRRELAQQEEDRKRAAAEAARKKSEDEVRTRAEADRRRREEDEDRKRIAAETARKKADEEARAKAETERLRREQEERRRADAEAARKRAEDETRTRAEAERRQREDEARRRVEAEAAKKRLEWDEAAKECFQEDAGQKIRGCTKLLEDSSLEKRRRAAVLSSRGLAFQRKGEKGRALRDYNDAIELNGGSAALFNNRGMIYLELKDFSRALQDYDRLVALEPNQARAYFQRGNIHADRRDCYRAVADYTKAISIDPAMAPAYFNRGLCYELGGERARAVVDFRAALQLKPNELKYLQHLRRLSTRP